MWENRDEGKIPIELFEDWKLVIIRHVDEQNEHILEKVFPQYPEIAFAWIAWRFEADPIL